MTPEAWIAAATAVAAMFGLNQLGPGIWAWMTGRQERQRTRVEQVIEERDKAENEAEHEAVDRRLVQEYASHLRVLLIGTGYPYNEIPPFPRVGLWREPAERTQPVKEETSATK